MKNDLLKITDLFIQFNKRRFKKRDKIINAVNGISFSIKEGEILGLAGESGCGKTLTALSIAGLLPEKAKIIGGEIKYKNTVLTSMSENELINIRKKEISIIFQEYRNSLNPLIKVGNQITETLELAGEKDKIKNKMLVIKMLKTLGFEDSEKIFDVYPHQLSGGMCQRIITAIAAIGNPKLLLADEPSSALDAESQKQILSLITKMNHEYGAAVLIISHDLSIIQKFCSRYLIMYAGKIIEEGLSGSFFNPLHPYTKALINAAPDKNKRGKKLENIPGNIPGIEDNLTGCPFAPRCKKAKSICNESFPPEYFYHKCEDKKVFCYFPEETNG